MTTKIYKIKKPDVCIKRVEDEVVYCENCVDDDHGGYYCLMSADMESMQQTNWDSRV